MIKMIVCDMDGTLLDHDKIADKTLSSLHKAIDLGVELVIASGRDYYGVTHVLEPFGIKCNMILGNGAQYCDNTGKVLMDCYLNKNNYKDIINIFESHHIAYMVFTTDGFYSGYDRDYVRDRFAYRCNLRFNTPMSEYLPGGKLANSPCCKIEKIDDVDEFLKRDIEIIKVEAFSPDEQDIIPTLPELEQIKGISYLSSFVDNVEVTNQNAQKGLILEKVIQLKGLTKEEVIVIGDGMNDITLFDRFPYSFAPSNAEKKIKALAYQVVGSCKDGGAGEAIEYALTNL